MVDLPEIVESGEIARLIPVIADSRKEQRVTSVFLATLSAVPDFAQALLASLGQRLGNRTVINSFTEVVLKNQPQGANDRPDGLLVVDWGRKNWTALFEAKIGSTQLDPDQVQRYVQLARDNGIDALITISNHFVAKPDHIPVAIPKILLRKVKAFHWSWKFILTEAILLQTQGRIKDPDQAFILREFIRFASHESVGVRGFDQMPPEWSALMTFLQGGAALKRTSKEVEAVISAWHQEVRDLSLRMSHHLGVNVEIKVSRSHAADPEQRIKDNCAELVDKQFLTAALQVPAAASEIELVADLNTKTIRVGMEMDAPRDRQRSSARVNWLLRQLKQTEADRLFVRIDWPNRAQDIVCSLSDLRENPKMVADHSTQAPRAFHVFYVASDARRFAGRRTFIEEIERAVPEFYDRVGQYLEQWRPKPPKPVESKEKPEAGGDPEDQRDEELAATNAGSEKKKPSPGNYHEGLLEIPDFLKRIPNLLRRD